ncbi:unnamed protein product, partial [Mesorhabditis spiculigera]
MPPEDLHVSFLHHTYEARDREDPWFTKFCTIAAVGCLTRDVAGGAEMLSRIWENQERLRRNEVHQQALQEAEDLWRREETYLDIAAEIIEEARHESANGGLTRVKRKQMEITRNFLKGVNEGRNHKICLEQKNATIEERQMLSAKRKRNIEIFDAAVNLMREAKRSDLEYENVETDIED